MGKKYRGMPSIDRCGKNLWNVAIVDFLRNC